MIINKGVDEMIKIIKMILLGIGFTIICSILLYLLFIIINYLFTFKIASIILEVLGAISGIFIFGLLFYYSGSEIYDMIKDSKGDK